MTISKRVKSFFITASSIAGTAFMAVVFTPEWAEFVVYLKDQLASLGVPTVIVLLLGVLVSEVWKEILNRRTQKKEALGMVAAARGQRVDSLYY